MEYIVGAACGWIIIITIKLISVEYECVKLRKRIEFLERIIAKL